MTTTPNNVRLAYNGHDHRAFCGACEFADGAKPLFAEVRFARNLIAYGEDYGRMGMLVLDSGGDPDFDVPTLTLNMMSEDGFACAYTREFDGSGQTWEDAKRWAELNIPAADLSDEILTGLGFTLKEF